MKCPKCGSDDTKESARITNSKCWFCCNCQSYWTIWQQDYIDKLEKENKQLKEENEDNDLAFHYTNEVIVKLEADLLALKEASAKHPIVCSYCNEVIVEDATGDYKDEILRHVLVCLSHPIGIYAKSIDKLKSSLALSQGRLSKANTALKEIEELADKSNGLICDCSANAYRRSIQEIIKVLKASS